ncbi:unnamed protein product [Candidula unifasciata]|uniref:Allatotropin n=1 Tax=Candidula unifasciata TaxID=100452 RepID=A0A8S3YTQ3_9EUPU|nr:unnamed protein product [Candidula unifasciata]
MSRSSVSRTLVLVILFVCLCHVVLSDKSFLHRQKRGFRGDAATRVAHGFGKRDYLNSRPESSLQYTLGAADNSPHSLEDISDGTLMTVANFAELLTKHPNLGKALLKKFVDIDGDGLISTEELFRPVLKK